ncbi:guanine nucleotide binding protein, alpha subunit [Chytriomyces cf. hyalinus JEL632]|nr:guanine nucleotide binding protein, alpha subunit [Chytriomyces cf. hyalinus JEL632]
MGCVSSAQVEPHVSATHKAIERQIRKDKKEMETHIKVLLLGPGESGKSTILKQFRYLYGNGFSDIEVQVFRSAIIVNLITCIQTLITAMENLKIPYGFDPSLPLENLEAALTLANEGDRRQTNATTTLLPTDQQQSQQQQQSTSMLSGLSSASASSEDEDGIVSKGSSSEVKDVSSTSLASTENGNRSKHCARLIAQCAKARYEAIRRTEGPLPENPVSKAVARVKGINLIFGLQREESLPPDIAKCVSVIWNDPGVQYCYTRSNEFQLIDCCKYLADNASRICAPGYAPLDDDILQARIMTTAVAEHNFVIQHQRFSIFDVGGQRSQRKKWAAYFDGCNAIIFVIAISCYDQLCFEDYSTNRMVEALNVLGSICNHPLFKKTDMILFLNKMDLFTIKLATKPIRDFFSDYTGDATSVDDNAAYFVNRCISLNKYPNDKDIYPHFTSATDTKQIAKVLMTVAHCILSKILKDIDLL